MVNLENKLSGFELFLKSYYQDKNFQSKHIELNHLYESINYSLFSGGKRFRPMLSLATSEIFDIYPQRIFPYAASVESIHTYSLIHDDLPCMDNDDFRRGKATNHIKFGEDIALLAGDALISEAFAIIAKNYEGEPSLGMKLTSLLAGCIGPQGMVAGQALDLRSNNPDEDVMNAIHLLKTGQLIKSAVVGVGLIAGCNNEELKSLESFSINLGMAFQLADDLHDAKEVTEVSEASMVNIHNKKAVHEMLEQKSNEAFNNLKIFGKKAISLKKLIEFNLKRKK